VSFSRVQSQHFVPVHFTMSRQAQHFVNGEDMIQCQKPWQGAAFCVCKKTLEGKRRQKSSIFSFQVFYTRREVSHEMLLFEA